MNSKLTPDLIAIERYLYDHEIPNLWLCGFLLFDSITGFSELDCLVPRVNSQSRLAFGMDLD